jgi:hypothetical protein
VAISVSIFEIDMNQQRGLDDAGEKRKGNEKAYAHST